MVREDLNLHTGEFEEPEQSPTYFPTQLAFVPAESVGYVDPHLKYMTASVVNCQSNVQADSFQRVLHVRVPRYLKKWVSAGSLTRVSY